ncbi:alanine racemase [uncultured Croceitalea sp.]|uniref:alanine racemase n=1 Tax=uncultured Croceitalea sp. TaxID=1798908 RepID=UPI00374EAB18
MSNIGETTLAINLSALEHNINFIKSKLNSTTKFLAVVKAFAYGSDMVAVAKKLESLHVDYFAVAYVKEGVLLRDAGIKSPILVLHPQAINFEELINRCLEPSLYSPRILKNFLKTAQEKGQTNYPVHLKFNTGLNRLGFCENDTDYILEQLKDRAEVKILSIFSHLAASEDKEEHEFSLQQIKIFKKINTVLSNKLGYSPMRHMLNTSGIINYPEAQFEMVRSGIGMYGYSNHIEIDTQLKPVATLKTIISQIHKIEPNESVGYNRGYISNGYRIIATLPIGHADGISRQHGNGKSFVSVKGKKAPIIGNVCMDMVMIDITDIDCKEGDEVIIFGKNFSAEDFANTANTISYEILTSISQRVKRTIQ